jgi:hypothetical protein
MKLVAEACQANPDFKLFMVEITYQKHPVSALVNPRSTYIKLTDLLITDSDDDFQAISDHKGITAEVWKDGFNKILETDKAAGFIDYFLELILHFKARLYMKEAVLNAPVVRDWSPSLDQLKDEAGDFESYGIVQITFKNDAVMEDKEIWAAKIESDYDIWYERNEVNGELNKDVAQANSKLLKDFLERYDKLCAVQLGQPKDIKWNYLENPSDLAPAFKEIIFEDLKRFPQAIDEQQGHLLRGD